MIHHIIALYSVRILWGFPNHLILSPSKHPPDLPVRVRVTVRVIHYPLKRGIFGQSLVHLPSSSLLLITRTNWPSQYPIFPAMLSFVKLHRDAGDVEAIYFCPIPYPARSSSLLPGFSVSKNKCKVKGATHTITKVYVPRMRMCVCVCIGSNMNANSGHVRHHVTIAYHSTAVVTLTANEFLYNLAGKRVLVVTRHSDKWLLDQLRHMLIDITGHRHTTLYILSDSRNVSKFAPIYTMKNRCARCVTK